VKPLNGVGKRQERRRRGDIVKIARRCLAAFDEAVADAGERVGRSELLLEVSELKKVLIVGPEGEKPAMVTAEELCSGNLMQHFARLFGKCTADVRREEAQRIAAVANANGIPHVRACASAAAPRRAAPRCAAPRP